MSKTNHIEFLRALKRKIGECDYDNPITFIAKGEHDALEWAIQQVIRGNKE